MNILEKFSIKATNWVGTPKSIALHTVMFTGIFGLSLIGISTDKILLILTTAVSLEAIYLAIFIQMTVNRNTKSLEAVEDDIENIQEDVKGLEEDVGEISDDIEEIQEEDKDENIQELKTTKTLEKIETGLQKLLEDIEALKKSRANS